MLSDRLIIFDFDGVVVDSEPIAIQVIQKSLENINLHFSYKDCFRAFVGHSFDEGLNNLADDHHLDILMLPINFETNTKTKINLALARKLEPIKNVKEALRNMPHKKCIASGSDYNRIEISLKKTGTKQFFNGVFSSSSVSKGKPAPDVFQYAAAQMGYSPQECTIIEDSEAGMRAGLAAGIKTFLYSPTSNIEFEIPSEVIAFTDMKILPSLL
jgi:HAD superfamily hydrolase (TIGR01509 family)